MIRRGRAVSRVMILVTVVYDPGLTELGSRARCHEVVCEEVKERTV